MRELKGIWNFLACVGILTACTIIFVSIMVSEDIVKNALRKRRK